VAEEITGDGLCESGAPWLKSDDFSEIRTTSKIVLPGLSAIALP